MSEVTYRNSATSRKNIVFCSSVVPIWVKDRQRHAAVIKSEE
jgi:hypothetical protein